MVEYDCKLRASPDGSDLSGEIPKFDGAGGLVVALFACRISRLDGTRPNRSASIVSGERVVFNIKGNDYRPGVAINYHYQILLIIWLGTHQEYDKIDVIKVTYEKERYADSSNSN
jgi:hypothetical protein